jgi:RNA polymerase sigma-70 factor (ECF subfamily)
LFPPNFSAYQTVANPSKALKKGTVGPEQWQTMGSQVNSLSVVAEDWAAQWAFVTGPLARMSAGMRPAGSSPRKPWDAQQAAADSRVMSIQGKARLDDATLIRAAQRGDRAAFEELVRHYDHAVLRLALHLTGSEPEAQDVYQDAFLKAYRNIGSFRFECSFYTWIYRIVTNLCLDYLRKKQVRKEDQPVMVDSNGEAYDLLDRVADGRSGANPERDLMRRELGSQIARALQRLTPRERMVFEMKHYQGLKLRTIGEMLNTTEETAKNTLFRATQKLRGSLAGAR